jgi:hypothetical protein
MFRYTVNNIPFGKVFIIKDNKEKYVNIRNFFSQKCFRVGFGFAGRKASTGRTRGMTFLV